MKTLSISVIIAIAAGLFASRGESKAPPEPQIVAVVESSDPAPAESMRARTSPRLARRLEDREKDSLVGLTLLLALQRGAHSR